MKKWLKKLIIDTLGLSCSFLFLLAVPLIIAWYMGIINDDNVTGKAGDALMLGIISGFFLSWPTNFMHKKITGRGIFIQ